MMALQICDNERGCPRDGDPIRRDMDYVEVRFVPGSTSIERSGLGASRVALAESDATRYKFCSVSCAVQAISGEIGAEWDG